MTFDPVLNLADLNGSNGFRIDGEAADDASGVSVSRAGDINGDGIDDLIIGAERADPNGSYSGSSYVVFGRRVNQAPTFVTNVTVPENTTLVVDIDATDDSSSEGDGLTYSLTGGADQGLFEVDAATGVLSFLAAPDFESPLDVGNDNTYAVEVTLTDAGGLSTTQLFNITVTDEDENEAPAIVTNGAVTVPENTTLVVDIAATDDSSSEGDGLTYSLTGGADQELFEVDATTGVLSFLSAPDFENLLDVGNDNTYAVEVTVTDAGGLSTAQLFDITVTDVGDDNIWLPSGDNIVDAGAGNNLVGIGSGNDTVTAGDGDDFVYSVNGGGGTNTLTLGNGNNTIWLENGDYDIFTGSGNDSIGLGTGTDIVQDAGGDNIIYMVDAAQPAGNKDILTGSGDDYVATGSGDDLIDGGLGLNTLLGGAGNDTFILRAGAYNFISDFEVGSDALQLTSLSFADLSFYQGTGTVSADAFIFVGEEAIAQIANTTVNQINNVSNFV